MDGYKELSASTVTIPAEAMKQTTSSFKSLDTSFQEDSDGEKAGSLWNPQASPFQNFMICYSLKCIFFSNARVFLIIIFLLKISYILRRYEIL